MSDFSDTVIKHQGPLRRLIFVLVLESRAARYRPGSQKRKLRDQIFLRSTKKTMGIAQSYIFSNFGSSEIVYMARPHY